LRERAGNDDSAAARPSRLDCDGGQPCAFGN
jgi:hypothetical protein